MNHFVYWQHCSLELDVKPKIHVELAGNHGALASVAKLGINQCGGFRLPRLAASIAKVLDFNLPQKSIVFNQIKAVDTLPIKGTRCLGSVELVFEKCL